MRLYPRRLLETIKGEIENPYALFILGTRRTGKTSLLYLIRDYLKNEKNIPAGNIIYIDLENLIFREEFNNPHYDLIAQSLISRAENRKERLFVLLDEVQYLNEPSSLLKYLVDHYSTLKFIVSGSSSLRIKEKFKDSLVGRKRVHLLSPLSFKEYLLFKEREELLKILPSLDFGKMESFEGCKISLSMEKEIENLFLEFLTFGGYPEVVLSENIEEKKKALQDIYTSCLYKDVAYLFKIEDLDKFNKLVSLYAANIGNLINQSEISSNLGISRNTLDKYSFVLESTFLLRFIKPFYSNIKKELTKMPKVFLEDTGLRNAVLGRLSLDFQREDLGRLVENFVYSELKKKSELSGGYKIYFWRTKTKLEIDFIVKNSFLMPIEVKYRLAKDLKAPSSLRSFIQEYRPSYALILGRSPYAKRELNKTFLLFLPVYFISF